MELGGILTRIRVDLSDWRRGMSEVVRTSRETQTQASQSFGGFTAAVGGTTAAVRALRTSLVGLAVTGAIGAAVREFSQFESSIARAVGAAGGGAEDMRRFSGAARQMAEELGRGGVTAKDAADALFSIASAGLKGEAAIRALRPSLVLASATQSGLANITETVIATLNQFGLTTAETTRVTNVFAAVNQNSLATMEKLSNALRQAGPAAGSMGKSIEETGAALAVLFNAGLRAETAGVGLRNIFLSLLDPSKDATEALSAYGISLKEVDPRARSLADIVDVFTKRQVDAAAAAKLFGKENFVAFTTLQTIGGTALREMQQRLTGTQSAVQQYQTQTSIQSAALKDVAAQVKLAFEELGEVILVTMGPGIDSIAQLVKAIRPGAIGAVRDFAEQWTMLGEAIQPIVDLVKSLEPTFTLFGWVLTTVVAPVLGGLNIILGSALGALAGISSLATDILSARLPDFTKAFNLNVQIIDRYMQSASKVMGYGPGSRVPLAIGGVAVTPGGETPPIRPPLPSSLGVVDKQGLLEESKRIAESFKTAADAEREFAEELQAGAMFSIKYTDVLKAHEAASKEISASVQVAADAEREYASELQAGTAFSIKYTDVLKAYEQQSKEITASVKLAADAEREYGSEFGPFTLKIHPAEKALKDYNEEVQTFHKLSGLLGKDFNDTRAEISAIENALRSAVREGMDPAEERLQSLSKRLQELKQAESLKAVFVDIFSSVGSAIEKMATGVIQGTLKMRDAFKNLAQSIIVEFAQRVIRQALNPLIDAMAKAAAAWFSGMSGFGGGVFGSSLGGMLAGAAGAISPAGVALGTGIGGTTGNLIAGGSALAGTAYYGLQATQIIDYFKSAGRFGVSPTSLTGLSSVAGLGGGLISLAGVATGNQNLARGGAAVGSLGYLAGGAATPYLAGAGAALNVGLAAYNLSQGLDEGAAIGTLAGTAVGGVAGGALAGTAIAPGVGTLVGALIGAAIGGSAGGFIGGLFGKPKIPHKVREALEVQGISRGLNDLIGRIGGARTPAELAAVTPLGLDQSYTREFQRFGVDFGEGQTLAGIQALMSRPGTATAQVFAGVSGDKLAELSTAITGAFQTRITQFSELNSQINTALADMLKAVAIPPKVSTSAEMLKRQTENFRAVLETVTGAAEAEIEHQRTILLGLTDPEQILQQTQTIRSLLEDRYNSEIQLVQQFVASVEQAENAWRGLRQAIEEQIVSLRLSGYGPTNPSEAVALTSGRFDEALAAFRSTPTAEGAQRVSTLAEPFLEAASRQYSRPSEQFRSIFDQVTAGLNEVAGFARSREEELQRAIVDALGLNADTVSGAVMDSTKLLEDFQAAKIGELNAAIDRLRVDTADVFTAMGFQITDGLGISAAKLTEIKAAQDLVKAAIDAAPAGTNAWLASIATYTSTTATSTTNTADNIAKLARNMADVAEDNRLRQGFATGLDFVPFNEFPAKLHRGEAVLTAEEAEEWRRGESGGLILAPGSINITITGVSDPEQAAELAAQKAVEKIRQLFSVGPDGMAMTDRVRRSRR